MMKIAGLFALLCATAFAQNPPSSAPPSHEQHQEHMDAMQQHIDAMRADIQKLNASLNSIRASIPRINDLDERNRWQQTIDMWQVLINHMQQMTIMHGPGMHNRDRHDTVHEHGAPE
ncbi:MAG: hypothetical protein JOY79_06940 [Acidobacteriaceae bacterium]|nr:hypothetical protein [Acidobacteriaceae bacterium]